jgi:hypothetical protein
MAQTGRRTIWATDIGDEGDANEDQDAHVSDLMDDKEVQGGIEVREERSDGLRRGPLKSLKNNFGISKHPPSSFFFTLLTGTTRNETCKDRIRFHPESDVIPRSLDWFDSLPQDHDQRSVGPYEAACAFSKSLPGDLILLAADVVSRILGLCQEIWGIRAKT